MIFNLNDSSGGMSAAMLSYSAANALQFAGTGSSWEAALLASGTLTTQRSCLVDLFIVAGGCTGGAGSGDYSYGYGGRGGRGGKWRLIPNVWLRRGVTYTVTVGDSDADTSIVGSDGSSYSSASGTEGAEGGQGAKTGNLSRVQSASAGSDGVYAYNGAEGDSLLYPSTRFSPGGGGADTRYTAGNNTTYSNSTEHGGSRAGGNTGGGVGAGGIGVIGTATAGAANTGAGGGAGSKDQSGAVLAAPARGGTGILFFRPHVEVTA